MNADPAATPDDWMRQAAASFSIPVPPAESAVADALRIAFHSSDALRWSDGWMHYAGGQWRRDETACLCIAMRLRQWIDAEADTLAHAGAECAAVEKRRDWASGAGARQRIDDALYLARALLSAPARPVDDDEWPMVASPTAREQVLAAAVRVLAAPNTEALRAEDTRRVFATRLAHAASKLWPSGPPMGSDELKRLLSAAIRGKFKRKRRRRGPRKDGAPPAIPVVPVHHLSPP